MRPAIALIILLAAAGPASGQPAGATPPAQKTEPIHVWINRRLDALLDRAAATGPEKQVETPSIAGGSTALVDQSSAPDLAGLAFSLFNAGSDSEKAPTSVTVSAYAIRNAITQDDPLDPQVYRKGVNARRWSFTVGRERNGEGSGDAAAANMFAVKYLAWNARDLSLHAEAAAAVTREVGAIVLNDAQRRVEDALFARFGEQLGFRADEQFEFSKKHLGAGFSELLAMLDEAELAALDALLGEAVEALQAARDKVGAFIARVRQAPQLAFQYQTKLRPEDGTDEHRFEAVLDYGMGARLNLSVNGSFNLNDHNALEDTRGGRIAGELQADLGARASIVEQARPSIRLAVAAAAEWDSILPSIYKAQAKLAVPIPRLTGVTLPISITWANRTELIEENEIRGQVGFTLDFSKLTSVFGR